KCAHPMARIRMPVQPVLNVKIASGINGLLDRFCSSITILRIEQRQKQIVVDRLLRRNAEKLSRGNRPGELQRWELQIPGTNAGSLDAAAHVLIERILVEKRAVDVYHGSSWLSPGAGYHALRRRVESGALR